MLESAERTLCRLLTQEKSRFQMTDWGTNSSSREPVWSVGVTTTLQHIFLNCLSRLTTAQRKPIPLHVNAICLPFLQLQAKSEPVNHTTVSGC